MDDAAARAAARDAWVTSTRHYFVEACAHWRTQPEHSLSKVRLVVEGFVHIVCVLLDPTFRPHERGELRRARMEKAISAAKQHLSPERQDLVETLKNLGNNFHHNQGVVQRSTPSMARLALLQCAELLAWMDSELLRTPLPQDYAQALRDLEGAAAVATPLPSAASTAALTPMPPATRPSPTPTAARPSLARRSARALWPFVVVIAAGVLAVLAVLRFGLPSGGGAPPAASASPEVAWIKAYSDAIASRDPDRIVAIHATPSGRFFRTQNQSAPQLRALYDAWFRKEGKGRTTTFRACGLASMTADGSRAVRCDTHIEPPLANGWGVIPTCLVFRSDGRLASRTESLSGPAPCPPPPL